MGCPDVALKTWLDLWMWKEADKEFGLFQALLLPLLPAARRCYSVLLQTIFNCFLLMW